MKILEGNGFLITLVVLLALGIIGYLLNNAIVLILLFIALVILVVAKILVRPRPSKKD